MVVGRGDSLWYYPQRDQREYVIVSNVLKAREELITPYIHQSAIFAKTQARMKSCVLRVTVSETLTVQDGLTDSHHTQCKSH